MVKFNVEVRQLVEVELDPAKFDDTFMEEFRQSFFHFHDLVEHAEHIAQLQARGVIDLEGYFAPNTFVEGYGLAKEMGISARVTDTEVEQVSA